jgi:hypothetical protein
MRSTKPDEFTARQAIVGFHRSPVANSYTVTRLNGTSESLLAEAASRSLRTKRPLEIAGDGSRRLARIVPVGLPGLVSRREL